MSLADNWSNLWIKVKGYSWKKEKCKAYLKILYNCLVDEAFRKSSVNVVSVNWFNAQFISGCNAVIHSLTSSPLEYSIIDENLCPDVLVVYNKCVSKLGHPEFHDVLLELHRCGLCLVVIWFTYNITTAEVKNLIQICNSDKNLCKSINSEVALLLQIFIAVNSDYFAAEFESGGVFTPLQEHQSSMFYLYLVLLYQKSQFGKILELYSRYISEQEVDSSVLILLHNLVACSHVMLGKPLMAIIYWRKAVECSNQDNYVLPVLYNLHKTYKDCSMLQPASEIINILVEIVTSKSPANCSLPFLVFENENDVLKVKPHSCRKTITDSCHLVYYCASYNLHVEKHLEAVKWFRSFFDNIDDAYHINLSPCASEYRLPMAVPSLMQVKSEFALALLKCKNASALLEINNIELFFCSNTFARAQSSYYTAESQDSNCEQVFIAAAIQLFYCLAILLYKIVIYMKTDCSTAKHELENCLKALELVSPSAGQSTAPANNDINEQHELNLVLQRLNSAKAMIYFNYALLLSSLSDPNEKQILSALQSVLRHDNRSIETRWQVVLILWKIGHREESIKTWCKTRSINYKLNFQEIKRIKETKELSLSSCDSITKRNCLQKDIGILNELLKMIS